MKNYLLATTVALAFLGGSNAIAGEEPQLIPDCYVNGQSQSEFHDCVQRNAGAGGTAVLAPRHVSDQASADEKETQQAGGYQSPPAGMWEREHRKVAAGSRTSDPYVRLSEPRHDAYSPPNDWDVNGERSEMDGPDWGPPREDGDGPYEFGPPPGGDWDDGPAPPPDGPYY